MDLVVVTGIVAALFLLIGLAEPLAARLRLPYSVILAVIGILIGAGAVFLLRTEITDAFNPFAEAILNFPIRSNVFLFVFLPTLLFQVTLGLNMRRMADDWVPILVMAVLAVVASTFAVGYALSLTGAMGLTACLLVGAIVSTTDPSAVVSIFRSLAAPRRLARIIEGESLLNDAAAIALFGLFMGFVMSGAQDEAAIGEAVVQFPALLAGGVFIGWVMAQAAAQVMSAMRTHELAQISVSIALPYLAYIVAERFVGVSGVIAVVTAGLTLNLGGPGRIGPSAWVRLREVWSLLAHWAGALIFILAALLIPRLLEQIRPGDLGLIAVVIAAALVARAVMVYGVLPLMAKLRLSPQVGVPYSTAILWGGLRGAVTLALALAVTESARVPEDVRRQVAILATGFTLFTLMVQGTTLRWVIGRLGLNRLSPLDSALSNQVVAVALQTVREDVAKTAETYDLTQDTVRNEAKRFGDRLDAAVAEAEGSVTILDRDRITLGLIALAGAERDMILSRVRERSISSRLSETMLSDADRVIEGARQSGRIGYRNGARKGLRFGPNLRLTLFLHNRLRLSRPYARLMGDRFEILLSRRLVLRDLHGFIDNRIRRIHGKRVAELLHELLDRRLEIVDEALAGLRLQYPGYYEALERRFIRRIALRLEEREYEAMLEDGLIGQELYVKLRDDLAARRSAVDRRPPLDLAMTKESFVSQFPVFADLNDTALRRVRRALRTAHVNPGQTVVRRETTAHSVFFIASGAVEVDAPTGEYRLGRGDFFGTIGILMRGPRQVEVRAIAPSTLLVLDEARFRRILKRSAALRDAVRESAKQRGIDPETLAELGAPSEAA